MTSQMEAQKKLALRLTFAGGMLHILMPIAVQLLPLIIGCRGIVADCWSAYWSEVNTPAFLLRTLIFGLFVILGIAALAVMRMQAPETNFAKWSLFAIFALSMGAIYLIWGSIIAFAFVPGTLLILIAALLS